MDPAQFIKSCLDHMATVKGTDLYLKTGAPPLYRESHQLKQFAGSKKLNVDDMNSVINFLMKPVHKELLERERSVDLSFRVEGHGRLRANVFYQQSEISCVIRIAWTKIPTFEELMLPPAIRKWALTDRGLILICGTVSSGKSTTANCMIDIINQNMEKHIITIEDPLEFVHVDKKSLVNQREIGQDTPNFQSALRYAVRQAPDVIFIGEMRDSETFFSALTAAEIGRLVMTTVHSRSVAHTFERLFSFVPQDARNRVAVELSYHLNMISFQRLVPRKDGQGYVPAFEVLVMNSLVADVIRDQRFDKLHQVMHNGQADGMQTLNQSLLKLYRDGLISELEMYRASDKQNELSMAIRGFGVESRGRKILGE